ncbi:MAG: hypothetical protein Q9214_001413 [Letrouitia sp. 1 TL-2023]
MSTRRECQDKSSSQSEMQSDCPDPDSTSAALLLRSDCEKRWQWKEHLINGQRGQGRRRWSSAMSDHEISDDKAMWAKGRSRKCLRLGRADCARRGLIQLFSVLGGLLIVFVPDGIHRILDKWGQIGHNGEGLASWPTDFSRGILPVPCHSHNDYWRLVPLYSAIEAGCISVEADVWLFNEELYVGHSLASLTPNRTLASLYIDPLLDILQKQNPTTSFHPNGNITRHGVFDTVPEQSLTLLIDFKTSGALLFPHVVSALQPLRARNYLTRYDGKKIIDGPITVVGTGNTPFNLVTSESANTHADIFFDAPLEIMWEGPPGKKAPQRPHPEPPVYGADIEASNPEEASSSNGLGQGKSNSSTDPSAYTTANSFYASVSFAQAVGHVQRGQISDEQMDLIRGHIKGAQSRGLKARYWELPFWPISLRNYVWDVLVKEGVDLLNVDDLKDATKRDWSVKHSWW